jgi:hypothetical protein
MMAVDIQTQPTFSAGTPRELFHGGFEQSNFPFTDYDASSDGKRLVMIPCPITARDARTSTLC